MNLLTYLTLILVIISLTIDSIFSYSLTYSMRDCTI